MSAEPHTRQDDPRRWSRAELIGMIIIIWLMAGLLFAILTTKF